MTSVDQLPPEILAQCVSRDLSDVLTFRTALPRRLHRAYNANVRNVSRRGPPDGRHRIYNGSPMEFPNLRVVCWCRDFKGDKLRNVSFPDSVVDLTAIDCAPIIGPNIVELATNYVPLIWQPNALQYLQSLTLYSSDYFPLDELNIQHLSITKLSVLTPAAHWKLPGTITDLQTTNTIFASSWVKQPILRRIVAHNFNWREHIQHLEYLKTSYAEFCVKTKHAIMPDTSILSFIPTSVDVQHPQAKNATVLSHSSMRAPLPDWAREDVRIQHMNLYMWSATMFIPPNLRTLCVDFVGQIDLRVLPATLESLILRRIHRRVAGYHLINLRELVLSYSFPLSIVSVLNDFRNSHKLATFTLTISHETSTKIRRELWWKFPLLENVLIICSGMSDRQRIKNMIAIEGMVRVL